MILDTTKAMQTSKHRHKSIFPNITYPVRACPSCFLKKKKSEDLIVAEYKPSSIHGATYRLQFYTGAPHENCQ